MLQQTVGDFSKGGMTMKRLMKLGCLALLLALALMFGKPGQTAPAEDAALKLWTSLSADQKKEALLPFSDKERYQEVFPANERPGLPFTKLTKEQKELVDQTIQAMTTKYGAERIAKVAKQTPDNRRYLTFYGEPAKGKPFAWRIAQHHLTLVYAEFGNAAPGEFGPVLLGGNPVGTMWDEEDELFLSLFAALSEAEKEKASGKEKGSKGIRVGELKDKARELATKLLNKRLEVFEPEYRKNFDLQLKNDGGVENLYLLIKAKDATKSHHKGGNYYWKLAGQHVLCDWQTQGNDHLHLTVKASPVKK
jgi:hypothetical protein